MTEHIQQGDQYRDDNVARILDLDPKDILNLLAKAITSASDQTQRQPHQGQADYSLQSQVASDYETTTSEEGYVDEPDSYPGANRFDQRLILSQPEYAPPISRLRKKVILAGLYTSAIAGIVAGNVFDEEINDPNSVVAAIPFIGPGYTEVESAILGNCDEDTMGTLAYQASVGPAEPGSWATADIVWNVPGQGGRPFDKLAMDKDTRDNDGDPATDAANDDADPKKPDEPANRRYPRASVDVATGYFGICDDERSPAITVIGSDVTVNLNDISAQVMLERIDQKGGVEPIDKKILDENAANPLNKDIFSQEDADILTAKMNDKEVINTAIDSTLDLLVDEMIKNDDGSADTIRQDATKRVEALVRGALTEQDSSQDYTIEMKGTLKKIEKVGMRQTETSDYALEHPTIVSGTVMTIDAEPVA